MNTLTGFWKKLHFSRVLAVFLSGIVLFLNVACSNGNEVGARPQNPPVQMGGQNNPHKGGGDGYTEYKTSADPTVKAKTAKTQQDRAELLVPTQLVAAIDSRSSDANAIDSRSAEARTTREAVKEKLFNARRIPELRQTEVDRGNPSVPNAKILDKVGKSFKDASEHLTGATDEAIKQGDSLADPALGN